MEKWEWVLRLWLNERLKCNDDNWCDFLFLFLWDDVWMWEFLWMFFGIVLNVYSFWVRFFKINLFLIFKNMLNIFFTFSIQLILNVKHHVYVMCTYVHT